MTRKNYVKLAESIRLEYINVLNSPDKRIGIEVAVACICDALYRHNSTFDSQRFKVACGMLDARFLGKGIDTPDGK